VNQDSSFQLIELFGIPVVTDSGLLPISVNSGTTAIIYVDVMNQGASAATFTVSPTGCCLTGSGSNSSDCNVREWLFFY
jgi:hypothetical protein